MCSRLLKSRRKPARIFDVCEPEIQNPALLYFMQGDFFFFFPDVNLGETGGEASLGDPWECSCGDLN